MNQVSPGYWRPLQWVGLLTLVAGVTGVVAPLSFDGLESSFLSGLFLFIGVIRLVDAFFFYRQPGAYQMLAAGSFAALAGVILWHYPLAGTYALALMLAVFVVIDSVIWCSFGNRLRPADGWMLLMFGGIVDIVLATVLFITAKDITFGAILRLMSLVFIVSGAATAMLAMAQQREQRRPPQRVEPNFDGRTIPE